MNIINLIVKKITAGEVEDALDLMVDYSKRISPKTYNQALILSCQLRNWNSQNRLGTGPREETFNRITASTTHLLEELRDEQISQIPIEESQLFRISQIENQIKDIFILIGEWEQKRDLAENPSERKRSILEIQKLKSSSDEYIEELNNLLFFQKKN